MEARHGDAALDEGQARRHDSSERQTVGGQYTAPPHLAHDIERAAVAALPHLPRLVEAWFPAGTWRGHEYVVGDLQGNPGDSLSINSDTGKWADFATGESGGDAVSLLAALRGYGGEHPQLEAAQELATELGLDAGERPAAAPAKADNGSGKATPIMPVPANVPAPPDVFNRREKDGSWIKLDVSQRWPYRDADGRLLGYTCRCDLADGEKEVIPQTYCEHEDGSCRWRWLSFPKPRPLYGLDRLAARPGANVIVVEGEKAADAGQRLLAGRGVVVLSWPGGGKAVRHADWSALAGRKVVLWPDADEAGRDTVEGYLDAAGRTRKGIAQLVEPHAAGVRVVDPPPDVEEGWDLADAERDGWTADDVLGWVRQHVRPAQPRDPNAGADEEPPPRELPSDPNPPFDDGSPPEIHIIAGELSRRVREAIRALQRHGLPIYARGGTLVRPVRLDAADDEGPVRRPAGAMVLSSVSPAWLRLRLADAALWRKWYVRTSKWIATDPPREIAEMIAAVPDEGGWPELETVVHHPVLWPDGSWIGAPGYHRRLLVDISGEWPEPGDARADAENALATIRHHLRHFPWATETDESAALSLYLTAVMRPVLDATPMHAIDAPEAGSGKSLLVGSASILATGAKPAVMDYGRDPIEASKRLDGMLLAGDSMIAIDNIEAPIEGATLCQTLTESTRRVRPLGSSDPVTVPCTALLTATGNNLTIRGDLVRRTIVCRLDARTECPETRRIDQDIAAETRERRRELVMAAQSIVRAYIRAGRPSVGLAPLGSFEHWSGLVRSSLVWLGLPDPAGTIERARADDPSRQAVRAVLTAWRDAFGNEPVTAAAAIERTEYDPPLREAVGNVATRRGHLDTHALGYWLRRHRDTRSGPLVLTREPPHRGTYRWMVRHDDGESGGDGGDRGDSSTARGEIRSGENADLFSKGENMSPISTMSTTCPSCDGEGCSRCGDTGRCPAHDVEEVF